VSAIVVLLAKLRRGPRTAVQPFAIWVTSSYSLYLFRFPVGFVLRALCDEASVNQWVARLLVVTIASLPAGFISHG
jgi:peptidoglycan/LPS O-acetylase OafA/YrhL